MRFAALVIGYLIFAAFAMALAAGSVVGLISGPARGDERPTCPIFTHEQFAERLDRAADRMQDAIKLSRNHLVIPPASEGGMFDDVDFMRLVADCARREGEALRALRNQLLKPIHIEGENR